MIEEIFIIHNAGVPLLSWKYRGKIIDQGLVSGFLSALQMFAGRTKGQKISVVFMEPALMVFEQAPNFTVVINIANREGLALSEKIIRVLIKKFQDKFESELETFSGNLDPFQPFSRELLSIISGCGIPKISTFLIEEKKRAINAEPKTNTLTVFDRENGNILYRHGGNPTFRDQVEHLFGTALKSGNQIVQQLSDQKLTGLKITSNNNAQSSITRLSYVDVAYGKDPVTWLNMSLVKDITDALKAGKDISKKIPTEKQHLNLHPESLEKVATLLSKDKENRPFHYLGLFTSTGEIFHFNSRSKEHHNWSGSIVSLMRCWNTLKIISRQIQRSELDHVEFVTKNQKFAIISWGNIALFGIPNKKAPFPEESTKLVSRSLNKILAKKVKKTK